MEILSLPCEDLMNIIGRLPVWHLRQARLVCKAFATASESHLFRRIYISPLPKDIEVFSYLTSHEVFSKYISEIVCDDSVLPEEYLKQPKWDQWWAENERYGRRIKGDCPITSHNQYIVYKKLHAKRQQIKDQGLDMMAICSSLHKLPNLHSIVITDCAWYYDRGYSTPHLATERDENLPMNGPWPGKAPPGDVWDQRTSPHHGFVNMIRALSISGTTITQLRIDGWCGGISHRLFSLAQPQDFQHLGTIISHLRKLELQINTHNGEDSWQEACDSGKTRKLLAAAKCLEHFKLSFDLGNGIDLYHPLLDPVTCFGNTTWDNLRTLELAHFDIDHVGLAKFLARQRALKRLTLVYLEFTYERHALFLDELRQRAVVLEHYELYVAIGLNISCSWPGPECEAVVNYLQYGGRNPLRMGRASNKDEDENGDEDEDGENAPLTSLT